MNTAFIFQSCGHGEKTQGHSGPSLHTSLLCRAPCPSLHPPCAQCVCRGPAHSSPGGPHPCQVSCAHSPPLYLLGCSVCPESLLRCLVCLRAGPLCTEGSWGRDSQQGVPSPSQGLGLLPTTAPSAHTTHQGPSATLTSQMPGPRGARTTDQSFRVSGEGESTPAPHAACSPERNKREVCTVGDPPFTESTHAQHPAEPGKTRGVSFSCPRAGREAQV